MSVIVKKCCSAAAFILAAVPVSVLSIHPVRAQQPMQSKAKNVIIFVCDGLRAGSVNPVDAPTLYAFENSGVKFANSHSLFPTFTTPNASALATGHYLGDTGDYSNVLFTGYPVFNRGEYGNPAGTATPSVENDQILGDIDDHFGGNYFNEESLLAYARQSGYNTASIGKIGPVLIQDVDQGNLDSATGKTLAPTTVIIDDATGSPVGVPLSPAVQSALAAAGMSGKATPRGANGMPGNNETPGALVPNTDQQKYFADALTKAILPLFKVTGKPFAVVYWSRDPDGTQHNQGDSPNSLTPGINGPTSKAAITNVDNNFKQLLGYLTDSGLAATTDIFVTADHGFSTISHHEIDANGNTTSSYAATFTYKDMKGRQEVNSGYTPVGFLAIDLAHDLNLPLYDPDSQIKPNGIAVYEPVDPTISQQTTTERQRPANGDAFIGGTGIISSPTDAQVVIAANGGSDLLYLPNGSSDDRAELAKKIVDFLSRQDYISGLFVDDSLGSIPGSLPISDINLKGSSVMPEPTIVINFRSFSTNQNDPLNTAVTVVDNILQEGQGQHGSFSRADTFNFMAAGGPDFKQGFIDRAPVSNADVQVTLANILGFNIKNKGLLVGRVISEALNDNSGSPIKVTSVVLKSKSAANGEQTILNYQQVDKTKYFDSAGFSGRTVGL